MMKRLPLIAALCGFLLPALAAEEAPRNERDPSAIWSTWSGAGEFEVRADFLPDYGLEIRNNERRLDDRVWVDFEMLDLGSLSLYVPYGNFEDFEGGRLNLRTNLVFRNGNAKVSLEQLIAVPFKHHGFPSLRLVDPEGQHLLTLSNPHVSADKDRQILTVENADLIATDILAELLALPELAGVAVGMARMELNLHIPPGADVSGKSPPTRGLSCAGRPFWPQDDPSHLVDVALISMSSVAYQGRQPGQNRIKIAPSAQLQNVNFGDAVWIPKFSQQPFYTYEPRDQHPFLAWNIYRITDGRIEQLGSSGVKHAFFSTNTGCVSNGGINCGSNNVLWPGCTDTYFSGTNDSNSNQGPRYDIIPSDGLFFSEGSFFDPGRTGSQTNNSGSFENRLVVDESELTTAGAEYFFDSWYVVMHDIDIWNSMGYRSITPNGTVGSGSWSFGPLGPFTNGPTIENWVAEGTADPSESHALISVPSETPGAPYPANQPQGHLRILGKATEVSAGRWRYNYAVQNYDFDRNIDQVRIPLPASAQAFETFFRAPVVDGVQVADWTVQRVGGELVFTAPTATAPNTNDLSWFTLFNFEVETDVPPVDGGSTMTLNVAEAGSPSQLTADIVAPGFLEDIFLDGFETL